MKFNNLIPTVENSQVTNLRQYLKSVIHTCSDSDLRRINQLILNLQEDKERKVKNEI